MSSAPHKATLFSQSRASLCQSRAERLAEGDNYSTQQIRAAWEIASRGDKEGLRRKDVDCLIRTFRPDMTPTEVEQVLGPIKGRMTYSQLHSTLSVDALAKVRATMPKIA